jgi:hypothetical protein
MEQRKKQVILCQGKHRESVPRNVLPSKKINHNKNKLGPPSDINTFLGLLLVYYGPWALMVILHGDYEITPFGISP